MLRSAAPPLLHICLFGGLPTLGPEWFLSFLLRALEAYRPLLEIDDAQPLLGINANGSASSAGGVDGDGGSVRARAARGVGGVDCVAYFARGLALLARSELL